MGCNDRKNVDNDINCHSDKYNQIVNDRLTKELRSLLNISSEDNINLNGDKKIEKRTNKRRSGGIIFNYNLDKILIVLSRESKDRGIPKWGLPKGHIEGDESTSKCAQREILEETGFNVVLNENCPKIKLNDTYYYIIISQHEIKPNPKDRKEIAICKWEYIYSLRFYNKNLGLRLLFNNETFSRVMTLVSDYKKNIDRYKSDYENRNHYLINQYNLIKKYEKYYYDLYKYYEEYNKTLLTTISKNVKMNEYNKYPTLDNLEINYYNKNI